MTNTHLAQFNVARPRAPMDDAVMAEFQAALVPINGAADEAPGFVWRLTDDGGEDATGLRVFGGEVMVNLSVWESRDALWNFVYRTGHLEFVRRRREWFHRMVEAYQVLWWVPAGHVPSLREAVERLEALRREGPGPDAFTFRDFHDATGAGRRYAEKSTM